MTEICLGFKAFDAHELLCHFVAQQAGLYEKFGVQVKLLDTNFVPSESLPDTCFQVACGAALSGWLQGAALKVVLVATDKPLFWLYSRSEITEITGLADRRIASYPINAPPVNLLQAILTQDGLQGEQLRIEAARDDVARLGLLMSGDVAAAVISSAMPVELVASKGFQQLIFFADRLRVPTTGLAVTDSLLRTAPEKVALIVNIFQQSLSLIQSDAELLQQVLMKYFNFPGRFVTASADLFKSCFSKTGISSDQIIADAVSTMACQLKINEKEWPQTNLYDFRFIKTCL